MIVFVLFRSMSSDECVSVLILVRSLSSQDSVPNSEINTGVCVDCTSAYKEKFVSKVTLFPSF